MELIILLIIAGAVLTIILGGVYLTCRRVQDYCALEAKREKLAARVFNSRLGKMLHSLNISLRDYLRNFTATAISGHLSVCQNCDAATACDSYLADKYRNSTSAREFCPNMSEFDRIGDETRR